MNTLYVLLISCLYAIPLTCLHSTAKDVTEKNEVVKFHQVTRRTQEAWEYKFKQLQF